MPDTPDFPPIVETELPEVSVMSLDRGDTMPCMVLIDGSLGSGVLIPGEVYRVAEVREHWEPTGVEGEPPHISTVVRFEPFEEPHDA